MLTEQSRRRGQRQTPAHTRWRYSLMSYNDLTVGARRYSPSSSEHVGRSRTLEQAKRCCSLMSYNDLTIGARPRLRMCNKAHRAIPDIQSQYDRLGLRTSSTSPSITTSKQICPSTVPAPTFISCTHCGDQYNDGRYFGAIRPYKTLDDTQISFRRLSVHSATYHRNVSIR